MGAVKLNRKLYELHEKYGKHTPSIDMPDIVVTSLFSIPIRMCSCGGEMWEYDTQGSTMKTLGNGSDYHKYLISNGLEYLIKLWGVTLRP